MLGDIDPEKAREALQTIAELEEKNLLGEGQSRTLTSRGSLETSTPRRRAKHCRP